jgi:hypothetical protein
MTLEPKPSAGRSIAGLLTVFHSPEKLFPEVGKTVSWGVPLVACVMVAFLTALIVINVIGMETLTRNQLESNPRLVDQLGQDRIDEMAREADTPARKAVGYVAAPLVTAVAILVVAGILSGLMSISDASAPYRNVVAVYAYSSFAYQVVMLVAIAIALAALDSYEGIDPNQLISLSPALLVGEDGSRVLRSVLSSLDLLSFWLIFLIGLGLSKISPRLKLSKAILLVLIPWAVYVAGKAGFAAIF